MKRNQPDTVGVTLRDLDRRLRAIENSPRLTNASIKDGRVTVFDGDDELVARFGKLGADYNGDTVEDWGLVLFDAAGDVVGLFTLAGVDIRSGVIRGASIIGNNIETDDAPNPRVKITNDAPPGWDAAIQFFQGDEGDNGQGYIAQTVSGDQPYFSLGPSRFSDTTTDRPLFVMMAKKADGTGDRLFMVNQTDLIYLLGEHLYSDVDHARFLGRITAGDRGVPTLRAGSSLVGGAVNPYNTQVYAQEGTAVVTTNAAGDAVLNFPETFPNGVLSAQVTYGNGNSGVALTLGLHDNPTTAAIAIRAFDTATGAAVGSGVSFRVNYRVVGW